MGDRISFSRPSVWSSSGDKVSRAELTARMAAGHVTGLSIRSLARVDAAS